MEAAGANVRYFKQDVTRQISLYVEIPLHGIRSERIGHGRLDISSGLRQQSLRGAWSGREPARERVREEIVGRDAVHRSDPGGLRAKAERPHRAVRLLGRQRIYIAPSASNYGLAVVLVGKADPWSEVVAIPVVLAARPPVDADKDQAAAEVRHSGYDSGKR